MDPIELHSEDDSGASAIRGVMIQKREALKCIEREIAQLVGKKSEIEKLLVFLDTTLGPRNRVLLPNELLSRIFVLAVEDHGPVVFPMCKKKLPPQLTISHVCSHWRKVALCTSELWSSTRLAYLDPTNRKLDNVVSLHQRWLMRARNFPVSLSFDFRLYNGDEFDIATTLQRMLLPFQVKKLHLTLSQDRFMELSSFPENMLSNLAEFALDVTTVPYGLVQSVASISNLHPFIPRLRSITLHCDQLDTWLDRNFQSLPWCQLRAMDFNNILLENPNAIIKILRQVPTLHVLTLRVFDTHAGSLEDITMPSLRDFDLIVENLSDGTEGINLDRVLYSFTCPSLTKFALFASHNWTAATFEILKGQYNMQGLQEVEFSCDTGLPVSCIFQHAPLLRSLLIVSGFILDDEAIIGISNGTLARFLGRLKIYCICDIEEVLGMVEARKKTADALIDNGCSWSEEITVLRNVVAPGKCKAEYGERVKALKGVGISITFAG